MSVALDLIESAFRPGRWETDGPESHAKRAQELVPLLVAVARAAEGVYWVLGDHPRPCNWDKEAALTARRRALSSYQAAEAALEQYANTHLP